MKLLLFIVSVAVLGFAQTDSHPYPFLLRISHETFDDYSCALLQTTGAFHLEFARGGDIKVVEGVTGPEDLSKVQRILEGPPLEVLSQEQVEEPIVRSRTERLQLTIRRHDYWQDLFFQSIESEQPFKRSLEALISWLDDLHKLPHKEFSEEEGKQNCLPPKEIVLKKRDPFPAPSRSFTPSDWAAKSVLKVPPLAPIAPTKPVPVRPLLRAYSFAVKSSDARQFCTLIADSGRYRFEDRYQKMGKPVNSRITVGVLNSEERAQLLTILDNPRLAQIRHHEPRGSAVVPVLGDMLNLTITRPSGDQNIILSSSFGRQFGSFYGGDADTTVAQKLTKFLKDRIENGKTQTLDKSTRNDCTELP